MKDFFKIHKITFESAGIDYVFVMSPLKVRHLENIQRIAAASEEAAGMLYNGDATDLHVLHDLIVILEELITPSIGGLSVEVLNDIVEYFVDVNFNDSNFTKKKAEVTFAQSLDFLISQGHGFADIMEYTLPQFHAFLDAASKRLSGNAKSGSGKTKVDASDNPLAALQRLGIPITNN